MARVCLGGTFDPFHIGHQALLERAMAEAGPDGCVFVGLVADEFSAAKRDRSVAPYDERERRVRDWWDSHGDAPELVTRALADKYGPSATGDYDTIVASTETRATADEINRVRTDNGLKPLKVSVVPYILGDDLLPVSGTRIAAGLIDAKGHRRAALRIAVGSQNPVKVNAIQRAFDRWMPGVGLDVNGHSVPTGVPEQPRNLDTIRGAERRARAALESDPKAEYGVGLEAGLFESTIDGRLLDVQHCVIVDRTGFLTHGHGGGFAYPPEVAAALSDPEKTVTDVLAPIANDPELGKTTGAIGWLTAGRLDRTRLSEQAVEAALVPRVRRELYTS